MTAGMSKQDKKKEKQARLAQALRNNLKRRKQQTEISPEPPMPIDQNPTDDAGHNFGQKK